MRCRPLVVAAIVCFASVLARAQDPTADPINGSWKLNVAKSTYSPGPPPPATAVPIHRFSSSEGGWNLFELSSVNAQGDPIFQFLAFKVDGKQYPVYTNATLAAFATSGKQSNVTRSYRRIDAYTTEFITYTDGVAGIPATRSVSKDGKTYTETTKGKNAKGQDVHNVRVFDRVR
jgi:hypothetical protein